MLRNYNLSHFIEKISFRQSLDKRVYVTMSRDKKGLCHASIPSFFRHVDPFWLGYGYRHDSLNGFASKTELGFRISVSYKTLSYWTLSILLFQIVPLFGQLEENSRDTEPEVWIGGASYSKVFSLNRAKQLKLINMCTSHVVCVLSGS